MEFELKRNDLTAALVILGVLILVGLGLLGSHFTPRSATGEAQVLGWQDWRLMNAEREREIERAALQADVAAMIDLLNRNPDPVAAQMLLERVSRRTQDGDATLSNAREATLQAASSVRDWAIGQTTRIDALEDAQSALALLQPNR